MKCGSPLTHSCPQCGTQLPAEAQFCYKCGHRLDGTQPEEAQDRLQQYIPKELLAKLESARSGGGMQGERRVVTMLFCDVQASRPPGAGSRRGRGSTRDRALSRSRAQAGR